LGKLVAKEANKKNNWKIFFVTSILALLVVLYYYKYFDFTKGIFNDFFGVNMNTNSIIAPLGISFITFSAISYIIDIYRGDSPAGNLLDVALYITFFPKVVSGPIILWKNFEKQIATKKIVNETFLHGLNLIMVGFAKKLILADTFGITVSKIQEQLSSGIDVPTAWGGALLYMLQIYYDFSGYSDIAIGLSELFGFHIEHNFEFPYISTSISEFWRKWHISLGIWFREYIYIPLGGNRKGKNRTLWNLFVVFLVTGIWHGAGWGYVSWGIMHGICVVIERVIKDRSVYLKTPKIFKWAITMFIVMMGWLIFWLNNLETVISYIKIMFGVVSFRVVNFTYEYYFTSKIICTAVIAILGATVLSSFKLKKMYEKVSKSPLVVVAQEVILMGLMLMSILYMVNSTYSPFIYFQY